MMIEVKNEITKEEYEFYKKMNDWNVELMLKSKEVEEQRKYNKKHLAK